jgi:hypothetical protein
MEGAGAEYFVIFNDPQLRAAQIRQHARVACPPAHRLTWPRLTWLAALASRRRTLAESAGLYPSEPLAPRAGQALFGSTD